MKYKLKLMSASQPASLLLISVVLRYLVSDDVHTDIGQHLTHGREAAESSQGTCSKAAIAATTCSMWLVIIHHVQLWHHASVTDLHCAALCKK